MSRYLAAAGRDTVSRSTPPALLAVAATWRSCGAVPLPTRICRSAPRYVPRSMTTLVTVTLPPRSSSSPVPCLSIPNRGVLYHWVDHGWDAPPLITYLALPGLSPSARPSGPNASAAATGSLMTALAAACAALALAAADALACAAALALACAAALALAAALACAAALALAAAADALAAEAPAALRAG